MIIYNVTTIIEDGIHEEYVKYMKEVHMPEVMSTEKFTDCQLLFLGEPITEGVTYCAQYMAKDAENLADYRMNFLPKLEQDLQQKFPNKLVSFASVLKKV